MILLTDETNSDDFMVKNKQSIINAIYQLTREKQVLVKRIENLEKSKIRKTHMKLRMTNGFYNPNDEFAYADPNATNPLRFKATLDEGVDDVEPIRSILNEEDLLINNSNAHPKLNKKGRKIKITKQASANEKRQIAFKNKRASANQSSKSEIRNAHSFNYGANFRRTRESFLEAEGSGNSGNLLPIPGAKKFITGRHAMTQEEIKTNSSYITNATAYNTDGSSLEMRYPNNTDFHKKIS